jgi:hypothetical protein
LQIAGRRVRWRCARIEVRRIGPISVPEECGEYLILDKLL